MFAKRASAQPKAFVDPDGYRKYVAEREQAFRENLAHQTALAAAAK